MPKEITRVDEKTSKNLSAFWGEMLKCVELVKNIHPSVSITLLIDGQSYENIDKGDIKVVGDKVVMNLTKRIKITIFDRKDYELFFCRFFDGDTSAIPELAKEQVEKTFKFHIKSSLDDAIKVK